MSDVLRLTGLSVRGHHGVLAGERAAGQEFVVDVLLRLDLRAAGDTDELTATVDYGQLAHDVAAVVSGEPVLLIETLASRIAQVCLERSAVDSVEVTVHKPSAPIALSFHDVSVTVVRP